jgi:AcrR family transcriptional regulator
MLECAERVFARRGFEAASMDEIADAAGISKPMLYAYFDSKEALYRRVLERSAEDLVEHISTAVSSAAKPEARMWRGILALLGGVEQHPDWWLMHQDARARGGAHGAIVTQLEHDIMRLIAGSFFDVAVDAGIAGTALEAVEPLSAAFIGACRAMCNWWIGNPEVPKGTVALLLMNCLWMGFSNLLEGSLWLPDVLETET